MEKNITVADSDTALEVISELKAKIAKLYYIEKKQEYNNILNKIKKLEQKMYLGDEKSILIINKKFAHLLKNMNGDKHE